LTVLELKKKLVLGTVQLGLPYGINNTKGKPDQDEAFRILDQALDQGIRLLDTADAYGDATSVLGTYLHHNPLSNFDIVNKFIHNDEQTLDVKLKTALTLLHQRRLYAYMFHRFHDYSTKKNLLQNLKVFRNDGLIQRIGLSVYGVDELQIAIEDPDIDLIQLPLNPFDNSTHKKELLREGKNRGKEFHVRSIFLQGLLLKNPNDLTGNLIEFRESLEQFHQIRKRYDLSVLTTCLNYALHHQNVDFVLIGIENAEQLKQNVNAILPVFPESLAHELESINVLNRVLLNPGSWKP